MALPPSAPVSGGANLRGDYRHAAADYTVPQSWEAYSDVAHETWSLLYRRQSELITHSAAPEFLAGVQALEAPPNEIPRFDQANAVLRAATGWCIVGVPGLIPEAQFFDHLAQRRFPVTVWIRNRDELDYLVEPDLFHDFFGHVPLLTNPVFARFMQAYGEAGARAMSVRGGITMLARLYWYLVEFGLMHTRAGLRVHGAGILSSAGEIAYSLASPRPQRLEFDLLRVMLTDYHIDDYQQTYFVLDSFEQLFDACYRTDFMPLYQRYGDQRPWPADARRPDDRLVCAP